ncbi:hypothetical protein BDF14DRAFT_1792356 [Spinellus fusiger]|nr:hypothetical protein BDF14DRAFT_1792356 [Spinellus fusiger]
MIQNDTHTQRNNKRARGRLYKHFTRKSYLGAVIKPKYKKFIVEKVTKLNLL